MLTKEPSTRQPTPWHQDQPYYNIEGRQNVSFWIPVDPVSRASTLEFVAGSHRGPWLMPRSFMDAQARWFPEGQPRGSAGHRGEPRPVSDRRLGARAGRCGVLSHAHLACLARRRRHAPPARILGALSRRRHRACPAPLEDLPGVPGTRGGACAGAPMHHPLFPELWRAAIMTGRCAPPPADGGARRGADVLARLRERPPNLWYRGRAGSRRDDASRVSRRRGDAGASLRPAVAARGSDAVRIPVERPAGLRARSCCRRPARSCEGIIGRHAGLGRPHPRHDGPRARLHQPRHVRLRGGRGLPRRGRPALRRRMPSAITSTCARTTCASRIRSFRRRRIAP